MPEPNERETIKGKILIVDDDEDMRGLLMDVLSEEGHEVSTAGGAEEALANLPMGLDLVITDLKMPGMQGLDLMYRIKTLRPEIAVVIITAFGTIESAIEAVKAGAYDYLPKPFKLSQMALVVQKALAEAALRREVARLRQQVEREYHFGNMIGKSKAMQGIFDLIRRISDTNTNVLIIGKSGTGKERVAKAIHFNSSRRDFPFIPVNCAAIPETLLESELFGHVKGAFTDAKTDKMGLFGEADGGTLLLDEVSELPQSLQAKLLRVLQDKEVRRVGSTHHTKVDVRVLASSNLDLAEEVKQRRFRDDLFYRLNVIQIRVPPLRERRDDILLLAHHFLKGFSAEAKKPAPQISSEAASLLLEYAWPGNVRELENALERAVILARGNEIAVHDLPPEMAGSRDDLSVLEEGVENRSSLRDLEQRYIVRILERTAGNKYQAAKILGIDRKTLYRKLGKEPPTPKDSESEA